jgi:gamma-aminobutyric acid receptor subunit alpha
MVDCYFRQEWYDPRLNFMNSTWKHVGDIALHYDLVDRVWTPDAFFRNCKDAKAHTITVPNRLMRIYPDGRILYSQRS